MKLNLFNDCIDPTKKLLKDIEQAISWGYPDSESTGYSSREFILLLVRCREEIQYLQIELQRKNDAQRP